LAIYKFSNLFNEEIALHLWQGVNKKQSDQNESSTYEYLGIIYPSIGILLMQYFSFAQNAVTVFIIIIMEVESLLSKNKEWR
jgi:hypothetical protein